MLEEEGDAFGDAAVPKVPEPFGSNRPASNAFPQRLLSVGLRRPTLDDVFLAKTGREIRDGELDHKEVLMQEMGR